MSKENKDFDEMSKGVSENDITENNIDTDNSASEEAVPENADAQNSTEETAENADAQSSTEEAADEKSKKKKSGRLKALFKSRKMKKGGLSVAFTAIFIVAVVVVNMIVGLITDKVPALSFDLSAQQTYNLSQDTIDFISALNKEVTITVLASQSSYEGANEYYLMASTLLKQYKNYSDKIKIEYVDLTANPTYINNYPDDTLKQGDYIVKSGDKHRVLSTSDLFEQEMQSDYSYQVKGLKVEPAVTTAILNVTADNQVKVQFIDGFGDYDASAFKNLLEQNNYDVSTVKTMTEDIDKNAEAVILYAPQADLDDTSVKKIKDFLNNNGGYNKDFIYVSGSAKFDSPKLDALLDEWGMKMGDGVVAEMDSSKVYGNSPYISLLDYDNADYTSGLKDSTLNIVGGRIVPVEITNKNTASNLLVTSASAKLIPFDAGDDFNIEKVEAKQYTAAAVGTKSSGDDVESNVIVFGSELVFNENAVKMSTFNNGAYIVNMMNKVTENTDEGITISGKDLTKPNLGITSDQIQAWSIVCMGVFPVIIIIAAIVIYVRRRNR